MFGFGLLLFKDCLFKKPGFEEIVEQETHGERQSSAPAQQESAAPAADETSSN